MTEVSSGLISELQKYCQFHQAQAFPIFCKGLESFLQLPSWRCGAHNKEIFSWRIMVYVGCGIPLEKKNGINLLVVLPMEYILAIQEHLFTLRNLQLGGQASRILKILVPETIFVCTSTLILFWCFCIWHIESSSIWIIEILRIWIGLRVSSLLYVICTVTKDYGLKSGICMSSLICCEQVSMEFCYRLFEDTISQLMNSYKLLDVTYFTVFRLKPRVKALSHPIQNSTSEYRAFLRGSWGCLKEHFELQLLSDVKSQFISEIALPVLCCRQAVPGLGMEVR